MHMRSLVIPALCFALAACNPVDSANHAVHDASMTMQDMTDMLQNKTSDAFDAAFIQGMIVHHQGAIDMANLALKFAKHDEIKAMAREIISAQQKEIDQMRAWQKAWGYTSNAAESH